MTNKKLFNKKAVMVDLQPCMKLEEIGEHFTKALLTNLMTQKKENSVSAAIKLNELSLLSVSFKAKLLKICLNILDNIRDIDEQEKLQIRKKIICALDNGKKFLFIMFEFFPFSTKLSIISDPGPEEEQTSAHVCGLIRETHTIPYALSIFDSVPWCFGEYIYVSNNNLYNLTTADFVKKVVENKSLKYKLNIELSNVERIRELEINFAIQHLGLRNMQQIETDNKNLLLEFDTEANYENP